MSSTVAHVPGIVPWRTCQQYTSNTYAAALRQLTVSQRKQQRATAATMKIKVDV